MSGLKFTPDLEAEKERVAVRAVQEIEAGMVVGLGTGSTAAYAIRELGRRVAEGLKITGTATSKATELLAVSLGIPMTPFDGLSRVDLTIDGADDLDPQLRAIKGAGGAFLREKIIASASDREIVIVDSSKPAATLGRAPLPVEVLPFAATFVARELRKLNIPVRLRFGTDGKIFLTDQGAYIYDLSFDIIANVEHLADQLAGIPGLIEHGLFLDQIDMAIIAERDTVRIARRTIT